MYVDGFLFTLVERKWTKETDVDAWTIVCVHITFESTQEPWHQYLDIDRPVG